MTLKLQTTSSVPKLCSGLPYNLQNMQKPNYAQPTINT